MINALLAHARCSITSQGITIHIFCKQAVNPVKSIASYTSPATFVSENVVTLAISDNKALRASFDALAGCLNSSRVIRNDREIGPGEIIQTGRRRLSRRLIFTCNTNWIYNLSLRESGYSLSEV